MYSNHLRLLKTPILTAVKPLFQKAKQIVPSSKMIRLYIITLFKKRPSFLVLDIAKSALNFVLILITLQFITTLSKTLNVYMSFTAKMFQ